MAAPALTSLLWFAAILAMIPLALWLLKRSPVGSAAAQGVLRSVAVLPISPSQRIVTVEVGSGDQRRWLVLGVTPQNITALHAMPPQDQPPARPNAAAPAFARLLDKWRRDIGAADGQ